jgi:hypothetical protein
MHRRDFRTLPSGATPFTPAPKRFALNRPDFLFHRGFGRHPYPQWSADNTSI